MRRFVSTTLIAAICAASAQAAPDAATHAKVFSPAITAAGFRAYDKAISSDYMDGRKPGTVGGERATAWIVDKSKKLALEPGTQGSWFQGVPRFPPGLKNENQIKLDVAGGGG